MQPFYQDGRNQTNGGEEERKVRLLLKAARGVRWGEAMWCDNFAAENPESVIFKEKRKEEFYECPRLKDQGGGRDVPFVGLEIGDVEQKTDDSCGGVDTIYYANG